MDKSTARGSEENDEKRKLDLSALQNFNFASNWSESTQAPARPERDSKPYGGERRERRPDRRPTVSREGGGERVDRRSQARPERRDFERTERRQEPTPQMLLRDCPFELQILPEEAVVAKLTNAMRHSLRTYELFEVSRLVLEKPDRFQIGLRLHGRDGEGQPLFLSVPDGLPFLTEEAAVDHVVRTHLEQFFTVEEVEVEAPKGSFQFIARSTLTGDFLSPPNYHRYQAILSQYHQERFPNMPFDRFRSQVETVKDEDAIAQWLQSMTKQTRYKLVGPTGSESEPESFNSVEEARAYLLRQRKDQVVKMTKAVRILGQQVEQLPTPEIRPYVMAYLEYQARFPLDTANTLRGRLRRQHFFIFKKGSRGVSLVCAVKRKLRQPGQVFSDSVQALIGFLEENDQVHASQLSEKFLGISPPSEGEEATPPDAATQDRVKRLSLDLRWLLSEGYVTELSDGRLSVHPVQEPERITPKRSEGGKRSGGMSTAVAVGGQKPGSVAPVEAAVSEESVGMIAPMAQPEVGGEEKEPEGDSTVPVEVEPPVSTFDVGDGEEVPAPGETAEVEAPTASDEAEADAVLEQASPSGADSDSVESVDSKSEEEDVAEDSASSDRSQSGV